MLRAMSPGRKTTAASGAADWPLPETFPCIFAFDEILGARDVAAAGAGGVAAADVPEEPAASELSEGHLGQGDDAEPSPSI
jgi:hypothetical protein